MKASNKVSFAALGPGYIYSNGRGFEIRLENGCIEPGGLSGRGMTQEEKKSVKNYLAGLKNIFRRAKENHSFDDVLGNYNGVKNKYKAILRGMPRADIEAIGQGKDYALTFYVDGSVSSTLGN